MRATYLLCQLITEARAGCRGPINEEVLSWLLGAVNEGGCAAMPAVAAPDWLGGRSSRAFDLAMHYLMEVAEPSEASIAPLQLPDKLPAILSDIFSEKSLRARRFYAVKYLYGSSRRGWMSTTASTMPDLIEAHRIYHTSYYWSLKAPPPEEAYSDDPDEINAWEKFQDAVFVDDIPDEWSAADREKSHGSGVVREYPITFRSWMEAVVASNGDPHNPALDQPLTVPMPYALFERPSRCV